MEDDSFPLGDATANRRDFLVAGWLGYLPGTVFDLYMAITLLGACGETASEQNIRRFLLDPDQPRALGDFDAPHEPYYGDDPEEISWNQERWGTFRAEADRRGLVLGTTNDLLEFMCELGLIESDGIDGWFPIIPVPRVEDVIEVSEARRMALATVRLHVQFAPEKRMVREWLDSRLATTREPVETSIAELAEWVPLESGDIRWALALIDEGSVLSISPPPEGVEESERFMVDADWELFDEDQAFERGMTSWIESVEAAARGEIAHDGSLRQPGAPSERPCSDARGRGRRPRR